MVKASVNSVDVAALVRPGAPQIAGSLTTTSEPRWAVNFLYITAGDGSEVTQAPEHKKTDQRTICGCYGFKIANLAHGY